VIFNSTQVDVIGTLEHQAARDVRVAVVIPCYNEELTIAKVVGEFRSELPQAQIYVFDNKSSDRSVELAMQAGARVFHETRQGKGYVVQSIFRRVNADIYVMIDGDGTYPVSEVHKLMKPILEGQADMVIGSRLHQQSASQFRSANRLGNQMFRLILKYTLGATISDMLSGYRVFNREFVRGVPLFGGGFETETELTIKGLEQGFRIVELPVSLSPRPKGSFSKIRIFRDGFLILNTILSLFRDYKPLTFFGGAGIVLSAFGILLGVLVLAGFLELQFIIGVAAAILAVGLVIAGMLGVTVGLVLHTIVRRSQQLEHQVRILVDDLRLQVDSAVSQIKSERQ